MFKQRVKPMNDVTKFPNRHPQQQQRQAPAPVREHHPEVLNFMNRVRETEIDRDNLAEENARLIAELAASRQTVIDQSQTIRELTAARDRETRKAFALEAHIKGVATACHAALQSAIAAEKDAEESIRTNEETPEEREARLERHIVDTFGGERREELIDGDLDPAPSFLTRQ